MLPYSGDFYTIMSLALKTDTVEAYIKRPIDRCETLIPVEKNYCVLTQRPVDF